MKSEKGVTLTSLIVYVIGMVMVISIVSVLTTYFYKNIKNVGADIDPIAEYTKFNSYFTNEINKNKIKEGVNLEERVYLNYHTYGEALSVDFKRLWNTGMYKRGGMVALKNIK